MLNIGMTELFVFAMIALLVLGPEKLPEAVRLVAKWYSKIKRIISNVQHDLDRELRISELQQQMQEELDRIKNLESKMQQQLQALENSDLQIKQVSLYVVPEALHSPQILIQQHKLYHTRQPLPSLIIFNSKVQNSLIVEPQHSAQHSMLKVAV